MMVQEIIVTWKCKRLNCTVIVQILTSEERTRVLLIFRQFSTYDSQTSQTTVGFSENV